MYVLVICITNAALCVHCYVLINAHPVETTARHDTAVLFSTLQAETRKTYKALLDGDEFTGFDLSPE